MGVCCRIGVCCPPGSPKQVADLAEWFAENEPTSPPGSHVVTGSYEEISRTLLNSYRLVPRSIEAGPAGTTDQQLEIANRLLGHLGRLISHELRVILELAGHPTEE